MKKFISYLFVITIIIALAIRLFAFSAHNFYISPDEAHSFAGIKDSFYSLFTYFFQGANFLPIYRAILKLIYGVVGFNIIYYKIPALIAGILSIFVFFDLSKKVFKNQIIILLSNILFALNVNLIYYSTQVKTYEIDVLLCLIIIDFAISFKGKVLTNKTVLLMSIVSALIAYTSIPAIAIMQICFAIMLFSNKKNRLKLIIFELLVLSVISFEYFTYISQIASDNSLKSMWTDDLFFFAPKSLEAVNALVNFSFFNFFWWDSDCPVRFSNIFLVSYLCIFLVGFINFLREKITGYYVVAPVFIFLMLSYLNLYPFCNRIIVFLIPIFILITLKAFDYENKKYIGITFAVMSTLFFLHQERLYSNFDWLQKKDIDYYNMYNRYILPLNKIQRDEYLLHTGHPFYYTLDNPNVYRLENYHLPDNFTIDDKHKIYFAFCLVNDKIEDVNNFENFLTSKDFKKTHSFTDDREINYYIFEKSQ